MPDCAYAASRVEVESMGFFPIVSIVLRFAKSSQVALQTWIAISVNINGLAFSITAPERIYACVYGKFWKMCM